MGKIQKSLLHLKPETVRGTGYYPGIDALRAIACLAVLFHHAKVGICSAGWLGVDLFFVISGFLISGVLLDAKGSPDYFSSFYRRRIFRIFPIYYAIIILSVAAVAFWHRPDLAFSMRICFIYIQNFVKIDANSFHSLQWVVWLGHTWSLAVEEQFYLVWPAVILLLDRKTLPWILSLMVLSCWGARCFVMLSHITGTMSIWPTYLNIDGFAVGAAIALLVKMPGWSTTRLG